MPDDDSPGTPGGAAGPWRSAQLLAGATLGAGLLTFLHVPAGAIVGAVLGSAAMNTARPGKPLGRRARIGGLVLLGSIAGVRLDQQSLAVLGTLLVPLVVGALLLLLLAALLGLALARWFGLDPVTALFACAPGGASEIALMAEDAGARTDVVLAVHLVRVLLVVLVVLPVLVLVLGSGS